MALDQSHGVPIAPDYDEIVEHIQLYIDGFNQSDAEKFRQCFHEDSWIMFTDADGTLERLLWDVFDEWAGPEDEGLCASDPLGYPSRRCRLSRTGDAFRLGSR